MVARRIQDVLPLLATHRYDEMRQLPVAQVHIADVNPPAHDLAEPVLLVVIQPLKLVGSDISQVLAGIGYHPQVHKSPGPQIHHREDRGQDLLVEHFMKGVGVGHGCQDRGSLLQEEVHGLGLGPGTVLHLFLNLGLVDPVELVVDSHPQQQEGREGHHQGKDDDLPLKA